MKQRAKVRMYPREWFVVVTGGVTLAFTAWALAGVKVVPLHILLCGSLLTFLGAILPAPVWFNGSVTSGGSSNLDHFKSLLRFPCFWLGLVFLIYLLIGAVNPAFQIARDERGWWVEVIEPPFGFVMPVSVKSSYMEMNPFRVLASFAAAFSLMCGFWVGLKSRKSAIYVLWALMLSGTAMGFIAILQDLTEADKVLWAFKSTNQHFWGSFFYRNQATAYLNLILILAAFLFFYHAKRAHLHGRQGGPHYLCFLLYALVVASIGLALSRGGIVFGVLITLVFIVGAFVQSLIALRDSGGSYSIVVVIFLILCGGSFFALKQIDTEAIHERFGDVRADFKDWKSSSRYYSSKATWDMAQDRLYTGWGAGSFRYIFPMYQKNYNEIFYTYFHKWKQEWRGRQVFRYAHNDIFQFIAEYGLIGCSLLVGMLLCFMASITRACLTNFYCFVMLTFGLTFAFLHAFIDFIFNSPAYWVCLFGLYTACAKLLNLEMLRRQKTD